MNQIEEKEFENYFDAYCEVKNARRIYKIISYEDDKFLRFLTYILESNKHTEEQKFAIFYSLCEIRATFWSEEDRDESDLVKSFCHVANSTANAMRVRSHKGYKATILYAEEWTALKSLLASLIKEKNFEDNEEFKTLSKKIYNKRESLIAEGKADFPEIGDF